MALYDHSLDPAECYYPNLKGTTPTLSPPISGKRKSNFPSQSIKQQEASGASHLDRVLFSDHQNDILRYSSAVRRPSDDFTPDLKSQQFRTESILPKAIENAISVGPAISRAQVPASGVTLPAKQPLPPQPQIPAPMDQGAATLSPPARRQRRQAVDIAARRPSLWQTFLSYLLAVLVFFGLYTKKPLPQQSQYTIPKQQQQQPRQSAVSPSVLSSGGRSPVLLRQEIAQQRQQQQQQQQQHWKYYEQQQPRYQYEQQQQQQQQQQQPQFGDAYRRRTFAPTSEYQQQQPQQFQQQQRRASYAAW